MTDSHIEGAVAKGEADLEQQIGTNLFSQFGRVKATDLLALELKDVVHEWPSSSRLPIVYSKGYNVSFMGLEKMQQLDSRKFERVVTYLQKNGSVARENLVCPVEACTRTFSDVHNCTYLTELLESRARVMQVTELPALTLVPNYLVQKLIMRPLRLHASGTILATCLAIVRGWAINLGGGMHHASHDSGGGWCPYDDVSLAIHRVRKVTKGKVQKAMVIDLGAHQGNGFANTKLFYEDEDLFIIDIYNCLIFPKDEEARRAINIEKQFACEASGEQYMSCLREALSEALDNFSPDLILYVAGTDSFKDGHAGRLNLSRSDILLRDELVFDFAVRTKSPICMLLSGGYGPGSAELVADSVSNLMNKFRLV